MLINFVKNFESSDILITLITITLFLLVIILFFWFVISSHFSDIIHYYLGIINGYVDQQTDKAKEKLKSELLKSRNSIIDKAKKEEEENNQFNINLIKEKLVPFYASFCVLSFVCFVYMIYYKRPFGNIEILLVLFIFIAFSADLSVYFIIASRWIFLTDQELIKKIVSKEEK
jgi:hypothetical protein